MGAESADDAVLDGLLRDAARGDADALTRLLSLHRDRLCRMVAFRLDARLAPQVDASDIVQDALADAVRKLPEYCRSRPLPFYPWLHRLASERLIRARRKLGRRPGVAGWLDGSAGLLVDRLIASDTTPGQAVVRAEQRQRVHAALERLGEPDREVLIMRYLEDLSFPEIAAILDIGESAAKMRHLRALRRIHVEMTTVGDTEPGPEPEPGP